MTTPLLAAWVHSSLLSGQTLNGEIDLLSGVHKAMAAYLASIPIRDRQAAFSAMAALQPEPNELILAVADADPLAPAPSLQPVQFATVADIRSVMSSVQWHWPRWIPASRVVGLAAYEGVGKTREAMDLCRRVYLGSPWTWPDNQVMTLPPGTPSLWLCADGQHDEIAEMVRDFGMPDEAVILPAPASDPYANTILDAPATLGWIGDAIVTRKPWTVVIDSLTYATSRDLCEQRSIALLKQPFIDLAQQHQIVIILLLHLAKDGQALGKRIKGVTRSLLHLECPDPEKPERLRFWVEKSYGKKPLPLGVTMGDNGNTYDFNPPARPDPNRGGRPPQKRDKAMQFIRDALARQNDQLGNELCAEWVKSGEKPDTFWRAVTDMTGSEIVTDGGKGTGKQTVLHLIGNRSSQTSQTTPNFP
jgi:hypothetical protein